MSPRLSSEEIRCSPTPTDVFSQTSSFRGVLCLAKGRARCVLGSCGHGGTGHPGFPCVITLPLPDFWVEASRNPNWRRPALGETQKPRGSFHCGNPAPPGSPHQSRGYRKVPRFWLLLAGLWGGWCCLPCLENPRAGARRMAAEGEQKTWSRESERVRLLVSVTKHLRGTGLVWLAPVLCAVAGLLGHALQDQICRARGLARQTHAAGSRSRQAWCAWSPRRRRKADRQFRELAPRFQSGGTARLASHQTRQLMLCVACSALRNTDGRPGASVKV